MNAIILAHGKAAETVARHTPNWAAAFDGLTFISPSDDPLPGSLPIGLSCRNGTGAIERLLFAVALASHFSTCAILEYDCLVFPKETTEPRKPGDAGTITIPRRWFFDSQTSVGSIACSEVFDNEDHPDIFAAPTYGHCPWIATGDTWWRLLTAGADYQRGFPDRWLALAALRANVALRGMEGAYSRDRDFDAATARIAHLRGAPAIHGVKTQDEFNQIMADGIPVAQWQPDPIADALARSTAEETDAKIRQWPEKTGEIDTTGIETTMIHSGQIMKDVGDKVLGQLTSEAFAQAMREPQMGDVHRPCPKCGTEYFSDHSPFEFECLTCRATIHWEYEDVGDERCESLHLSEETGEEGK